LLKLYLVRSWIFSPLPLPLPHHLF